MIKEPTILLEEQSPHGNFVAIVEQDERVCTFYLSREDDFRAVWVRNIAKAPETTDIQSMKNGLSPMMESRFCSHPDGSPPIDPNHLEVLWFDSGDGAALLENNKPIAIIPHWSGQKGFTGYAVEAIGESVCAWPLKPENELLKRIPQAKKYWQSWEEDIFGQFQREQLKRYESALGPHDRYFAIDDENWPPKAIVLFESEDAYTAIS